MTGEYVRTEFAYIPILKLKLDGSQVATFCIPAADMTAKQFNEQRDWWDAEQGARLRRGKIGCVQQNEGSKYYSPAEIDVERVEPSLLAEIRNDTRGKFLYTLVAEAGV